MQSISHEPPEAFALPVAGPRLDIAITTVLSNSRMVMEAERVSLRNALGRVLALDVFSEIPIPPWDRSAMDGYAYRYRPERRTLRVIGSITADGECRSSILEDECVAVATGAALPAGCDTVAPKERVCISQDGISADERKGANVRHQGEEFRVGQKLISRGTYIGPVQIGLLASAGVQSIHVTRKIKIGVLSIGNELLDSAAKRLFDANYEMIKALCGTVPSEPYDLGIAPDDASILAGLFSKASLLYDAVVTTGATSVGDEDHFCAAIAAGGGVLITRGLAIKPGKPASCGRIADCIVVGLPGNPGAAYTAGLVFLLPILRGLSGINPSNRPQVNVRVGFHHKKKMGSREYIRVQLLETESGIEARRCGPTDTAMLSPISAADGFAVLAENETEIAAGDFVKYSSFVELSSN